MPLSQQLSEENIDEEGETQASPKGGWIKQARSRRTSSTYLFHAMTESAPQALHHNSRECLVSLISRLDRR